MSWFQSWIVNRIMKLKPIWNCNWRQYRGPAHFHWLTPNKRFEPMSSTVSMAEWSLFNRMWLFTHLITVHLLYVGQTVMIDWNHNSLEWIREVHHIYEIIRHMEGLYWLSCYNYKNHSKTWDLQSMLKCFWISLHLISPKLSTTLFTWQIKLVETNLFQIDVQNISLVPC